MKGDSFALIYLKCKKFKSSSHFILAVGEGDLLFFKCVPKSLDRMVLSLRRQAVKGKVETDNISSFDSGDAMHNVK